MEARAREDELLLESTSCMAGASSSGVISPPEQGSASEGGGSPRQMPVDYSGERIAEERLANERFADERFADADPGQLVTSLLIPVSVTMLLVVLLVSQMSEASQEFVGTFSGLMVYQEDEDDSVATIAGGVLLNGAVLVGMLFFVTTCLLMLYKFRCLFLIYAWLFLSVTSLLAGFGGFVAQQLLIIYDLPFDTPSFLFCLYNFAAGGTLLVFWTEYGLGDNPPLGMQQAYLVLISALLAWSATKTPEWSTWGVLGAVAVWDLIAVLTPRGPLKLLVEEAERRNEPIPGLVYTSHEQIRLGLGDFVFYSVLVGRASMHGAAPMWVCAVAVLAGLCATLALLPVMQKVLPALPISIAVGMAFYFACVAALTPMAHAAAAAHIVL